MFVAGAIPLCNPTATGISESDTLLLLLRLSLSPSSSSSSSHHPSSKCCLFNSSTMRILRKPVSLCLSLFSSESSAAAFSSSSSRIRFASGILGQSDRSHSPGKRKGIHTVGGNPLQASYSMEKNHETVVADNSSHFLHMGSCDGGQEPSVWSTPGGGCKIDLGKRIFCDRSLNMKNIVAVGFDMD